MIIAVKITIYNIHYISTMSHTTHTTHTSNISHLVLSSGGLNGMLIVNELKKHETVLPLIKTYVGTSIGTIISVLLILTRGDIKWAAELYEKYVSTSVFNNMDLLKLEDTFSLYDSSTFQSIIRILLNKFGLAWDISLSKFALYTQKDFYFISTCVETGKTVYFNPTEYPKMKLADAIYASCAIPLIWSPLSFRGKLYCDGALTTPYGMMFVTDVLKIPKENIMGFYLYNVCEIDTPKTLLESGKQILSIVMDRQSSAYHGIGIRADPMKTLQ